MTAADRLVVQVFPGPGFGENAYLAWAQGQNRAVAIDPGAGVDALAAAVGEAQLVLEAVLLTHAHIDHIEGIAELVRRTDAPVYLHPDARPWYDRAADQAAMFGVRVATPPPPTHALAHGQRLELGGARFEVRAAPGHASGHVVLYVAEAGVAFVGDVVFRGSIGRTDLPGGDFQQLMRSIREQILTLPDETVLYPGHGPETTVGHERVANPFLVPQYRGGFA
ncbi:MAG TPA: MBL fold metallo-hydrolase [Longimicrobiales bacterium]